MKENPEPCHPEEAQENYTQTKRKTEEKGEDNHQKYNNLGVREHHWKDDSITREHNGRMGGHKVELEKIMSSAKRSVGELSTYLKGSNRPTDKTQQKAKQNRDEMYKQTQQPPRKAAQTPQVENLQKTLQQQKETGTLATSIEKRGLKNTEN